MDSGFRPHLIIWGVLLLRFNADVSKRWDSKAALWKYLIEARLTHTYTHTKILSCIFWPLEGADVFKLKSR